MLRLTLLLVVSVVVASQQLRSALPQQPFTWLCEPSVRHRDPIHNGTQQTKGEPVCVRHSATSSDTASYGSGITYDQCRLTCGEHGVLWPKPNKVSMSKELVYFRPQFINTNVHPTPGLQVGDLIGRGVEVFLENLVKLHPNYSPFDEIARNDQRHFFGPSRVHMYDFDMAINVTGSDATRLALDISEAYNLTVYTNELTGVIQVYMEADTYFGIRHAMETLSQLIAYDEYANALMVANQVQISDAPKYPYRGILLDTSRNFIPIGSIKATIEAMAASKLNTFHWHITDSHSFPMDVRSYPKMVHYGAYHPDKIYTRQNIKDVVDFARVRGVRVLPEFDAPAHVGNGWQWGPQDNLGELLACFEKEPWQSFCVEPPCGQLNIANGKIYEVLGNIYKDMIDMFGPIDMFHYGGDEINLNCWNTTEAIRTWMTGKYGNLSSEGYYKEWDIFQNKSYQLVTQANGNKEIPGILWTSELTSPEHLKEYVDPLKYIIQIWTTGKDPIIKELLENKYRVIVSNYDALYLDCGGGAWVGKGNNWCSPYHGWQKVYDNNPLEMARGLGVANLDESLVLGSEAAMWTEQVDEHNLDSRIWPRAAAMAERLWSDPSHDWARAEHRMVYHRQRLVQRGVRPERLQPEWCRQNPDLCYINKQ